MPHVINLWNPAHAALGVCLLTAFLLGIVHGITPDEHTWPITFSYAVGSYSTKRGLRAGLVFSLAFTLQRAIASELAYLGLARFMTVGSANYVIYIVVGAIMAWSGFLIVRKGWATHLHVPWVSRLLPRSLTQLPNQHPSVADIRDPRPWMPALHGFIAGWGFGAFALIIYTVLAPCMPSAAWGWAPGAIFGLGTTLVQAGAGAVFGWWALRQGLPPEAIRQVALITAANTLAWGGFAFVAGGLFGMVFPNVAEWSINTGVHIHNLDTVGLPLVLVMVTVCGVGMRTLFRETHARSRSSRREIPTA